MKNLKNHKDNLLRILILLVCLISFNDTSAQIGGGRSFEYINLSGDARTSALGGVYITGNDLYDANAFMQNPALLDHTASGNLAFSYMNYYADIGINSFAYAHDMKRHGVWGLAVKALDYGSFTYTDASGEEIIGDFTANDMLITLAASHQLGHFRLGSSLKYASSSIESYNASAMLFDIGGLFKHPDYDFTLAMLVKNLGFRMTDYAKNLNSPLPFDVQLGMTVKPQHMPFRFTLTAFNLYKGDISYYDEEEASGLDNAPRVIEKVFHHFSIGTELVLGKNFWIIGGYNPMVRNTMQLPRTIGGAGFSYGFRIKVKRFQFAYSKAIHHAVGGNNFITLSANVDELFSSMGNKNIKE